MIGQTVNIVMRDLIDKLNFLSEAELPKTAATDASPVSAAVPPVDLAVNPPTVKPTAKDTKQQLDDVNYASPSQNKQLSQNLKVDLPTGRFEPQKKGISPVNYIRIFDLPRQTVLDYFDKLGFDTIPVSPEQSVLSGKYKENILSFNVDGTTYTIIIADRGTTASNPATAVNIKEFTPVALGLSGQTYNKASLIKATRAAVEQKSANRPELKEIMLPLIDVADGSRDAVDPELNQKLDAKSRNQLGVDFGEILAPIKLAKASDKIEFPAEGNFPLVDVVIGKTNYSVKSLTGSGTSFSSIADLMDSYESAIDQDQTKKDLFSLFKGFHPSSGGKNVDKIIRAAAYMKTPEYQQAVDILGPFADYDSLQTAVKDLVTIKDNRTLPYADFLRNVMPIMTAGEWGRPVGMPADGNYYLNPTGGKKPKEKSAGFPSYNAKPIKSATDILTYSLGVGLLNAVTKGPNSNAYSTMMTDIVNQSQAWLGKLDITSDGKIVAQASPFSKLQFKFQYHAPSHLPGNNLPGFMIVY